MYFHPRSTDLEVARARWYPVPMRPRRDNAADDGARGGHGLAYAGLVCSTVGWALAFIAGKVVLAEMTPLCTAVWRYAAAALVLLPLAVRHRPRADLRPAAGALALMVLCGGVLYPWLFLLALGRTSATNTALLIALNPVFTLLLSPLVGERLDGRRVVGVGAALTGAIMVITRGDLGQFRHLTPAAGNGGDLLAVAAAATWAVFNLASRRVVLRLSPSFINCVVYGLGGLALYGLARHDAPLAQLAGATPAALGALAIMAVLSSVVAGQFFLVGVRTVGLNRTTVFVYLVPVVTAALSALVLGERIEAAQAAGGGAVLFGVYWTARRTDP
jgi:drug/metabolite transporter (DMT)-like permease